MREIWNDIPGKEGKYQVSNLGNVRSCVKREEWYQLMPFQDTCGYLYVDIDKHSRGVHRLVADAFLLNADGKKEVNHKNGFKHDNRVSNLEWCSRSENIKHAYATGLKSNPLRGESIKARRVLCVDTGAEYDCMMDAEDATGAKQANISKCCRGLRNTAGGYRWRYADGGDVNVT
jgi:hypothetical protein